MRQKLAAEGEAPHWRERLAHLVRVHTAGDVSVALTHEITQPPVTRSPSLRQILAHV